VPEVPIVSTTNHRSNDAEQSNVDLQEVREEEERGSQKSVNWAGPRKHAGNEQREKHTFYHLHLKTLGFTIHSFVLSEKLRERPVKFPSYRI